MPVLLVRVREALWPLLVAGLIALGLLLVVLVILRLTIKARAWRRLRLEFRYRPLVDALAVPETAASALASLTRTPTRHLDIIGRLILRLLHLTSGQVVDYLRAGASAIGLDRRWRAKLTSARWWERAEAVHALGLIRKPGISRDVLALLDDPHEEVRAAAVSALGWLADPSTVPALLQRLTDETRHQKVRIVEALQQARFSAGSAVLDYLDAQPHPLPVMADLVGHLRLSAAMDHLIRWTGDDNPDLRAAAFRALGVLGPDERAYYHALKALGDDAPVVRAMAARALGRAGMDNAVPYLAALLTQEWVVSVEAALSLRALGAAGTAALESVAAGTGDAAALATHVLWDGRLQTAGSA